MRDKVVAYVFLDALDILPHIQVAVFVTRSHHVALVAQNDRHHQAVGRFRDQSELALPG